MKKTGLSAVGAGLGLGLGLVSSLVFAAPPGETWEVVTQAESAGMAMPDSTVKICLEKGATRDPKKLIQRNDCEVSDVRTVGAKITWTMRCPLDDGEMTGSGEVTSQADRYQGSTRISGKSADRSIEMRASFKGTRVGTACDPAAAPVVAFKGMENLGEIMGMASKQMSSAMAEQCEVANYQATELISGRFFGPQAACPGKEKFACKVIAKEVPRKVEVYARLAKHDDTSETSIAKACEIDMVAATRAICKTVDGGNLEQLSDYCPAEAKAFTEARRAESGGAPSAVDAATSAVDKVKKLKGLFGF